MKTLDEYTLDKKEDWSLPLTREGLEILCGRLSNEPKIRFCGIVNSLGKLVTGGFGDGIKSLINDDQLGMLYIQSTLELSMKREFNETLGNVHFTTTFRDNVSLVTIPIHQNYLLLVSVERNADIEKIVKNVVSIFERNGILDERHKPVSLNNLTA